MNSGVNYYFSGKSKEFLEQVKDVMTECMNDRKHSYIIDMGNASIEALQIGDGNTVVRG